MTLVISFQDKNGLRIGSQSESAPGVLRADDSL
jgi:hypothetical protein